MIKIINNKIVPSLVTIASLFFAFQFMSHTFQGSLSSKNLYWIFVTIFVGFFAAIGLNHEFVFNRSTSLFQYQSMHKDRIRSLIIVILNTIVTFTIASFFNVSTIFAASLTCVLSAFLLPEFESEAYSGSVAGMIGAYLCTHWSIAILIGLVTGIVFILFSSYFRGIGGRSGLNAYIATMVSVRILLNLTPSQRAPIEQEMIIPSFFAIIFAALFTFLLHKSKRLTTIRAAMLICLVSSILIPISYYTVTNAIFAGTVVGTSTEERIDNIFHLFIVAVLGFILFIPSFHMLDGIGGKLGILCFLSYQASIGLKIFLKQVKYLVEPYRTHSSAQISNKK